MTTKTAPKSAAKPKAKKKAATENRKSASKTVAKTATTARTKSQPEKQAKSPSNNSALSANTKKPKNKGNGSDKRVILIQQMAYFIAEQRGFEGGDPVQDWLAAERQVDQMLKEKRA